MDLKIIVQKSIDACKKISDIIKNGDASLSNDLGVIGYGGDKVKKIDKIAEDILIATFSSYGNIFSEERGLIDNNKQYTFIIDPIDGSDNFISNIPFFAVSISIRYKNSTIFGFIYDLNLDKYIYRYMNHSNINSIDINPTFAIFERSYTRCDIGVQISQLGFKFRSYGSTALSLSYARGVKFVLIAGKLRDFDIDAGLYINNDLYQYKNEQFVLVSKDKNIFNKVLKLIKN